MKGSGGKQLSAFALSLFLVSACGSVAPLPPPVTTTAHVVEKNFSLNTAKTAHVGEAMIRVKDYYQETAQQSAWSVKDAVLVEKAIGSETLIPGTYPVTGKEQVDGVWYDVVSMNSHPPDLFTGKPSSGVAPIVILVNGEGKLARVGGGFGGSAAIATVPAGYKAVQTIDTKIDRRKGYTNFELIYAGLAGGVIRVTYREYSPDDLARTDFFQDLTYNQDQKQLRFRDMAFEIAKATNESIEFKVVAAPDNLKNQGAS